MCMIYTNDLLKKRPFYYIYEWNDECKQYNRNNDEIFELQKTYNHRTAPAPQRLIELWAIQRELCKKIEQVSLHEFT